MSCSTGHRSWESAAGMCKSQGCAAVCNIISSGYLCKFDLSHYVHLEMMRGVC